MFVLSGFYLSAEKTKLISPYLPSKYDIKSTHELIQVLHTIKLNNGIIFYKEVENLKQALINNGFPNYIVDEQIIRMIKNVNQQNKHCTTPPSQKTYIKLFFTVTKCTTIIDQRKKY